MACPLDVRPHQWQPSSSMMISPYSLRNTGFHRFWLTSWLTFSRQPRRQPSVRQAGAKTKKARQPSDCQAFSSVGVTGFEPATTRPPDVYSNRTELRPDYPCPPAPDIRYLSVWDCKYSIFFRNIHISASFFSMFAGDETFLPPSGRAHSPSGRRLRLLRSPHAR